MSDELTLGDFMVLEQHLKQRDKRIEEKDAEIAELKDVLGRGMQNIAMVAFTRMPAWITAWLSEANALLIDEKESDER